MNEKQRQKNRKQIFVSLSDALYHAIYTHISGCKRKHCGNVNGCSNQQQQRNQCHR